MLSNSKLLRSLGLKHLFWALVILVLGGIFAVRTFPQSVAPILESETVQPIVAVGMPPQIALIREIASDNGWKLVCEGQTGRMSVVKLTPGSLPWAADYEEMWTELAEVSSSMASPANDGPDSACGWGEDSFSMTANQQFLVLAVGPPSQLKPLLKVARDCEVVGAKLTDGPPQEQEIYDGEIPSDWVGLVIDSNLNQETGPVTCLAILAQREWPGGMSGD